MSVGLIAKRDMRKKSQNGGLEREDVGEPVVRNMQRSRAKVMDDSTM